MQLKSGGYVLLLQVDRDMEISVGKLGLVKFNKGVYAYAGSALGGLEHRVSRHLQRKKTKFWHIDYLTTSPGAKISQVLFVESAEKVECVLSQTMATDPEITIVKRGVGSSDCKCKSHLYYLRDISKSRVSEKLRASLESHGLKLNSLPIHANPSGVS